MGALIPNPHDQDVSQRLDNTFSDPHLRKLRNRLIRMEPKFFSDPGNPRHLARISHRLRISPQGPPPPTPAQLRARWQYLLQVLLTDPVKAAQDGTTVAEVIRNALQVFVVTDDPQCTAITFSAIHDGGLPSGIDYQVNINPDPTVPRRAGNYIARIQLRCRQEIPAGANSADPPPDSGEVAPDQPEL
jgi:hypothetical protein